MGLVEVGAGLNATIPSGVPTPVGPSYPVPARQMALAAQLFDSSVDVQPERPVSERASAFPV